VVVELAVITVLALALAEVLDTKIILL